MAFEHSSGLSGVYDRTPDKDWRRVLFREGKLAQAAELMEMQSIIEGRGRRVSGQIMSDGNRVEGGDISVDSDAGEVFLAAGKIYVNGDVHDVDAATLTGVPMDSDVVVGVRLTVETITEVNDPDMLGLHPGSDAEGEPGAGRQIETITWGFDGDGQDGDLYQVYLLKSGTPLDQTEPPVLDKVTQAIALYDRDAHGSYVVSGCKVTALGKVGTDQQFSIGEGVANILGFKRSRSYSLRHSETESYDIDIVDAEPHNFEDGGSGTAEITVNHGPISGVLSAIVTKEKTVTLTKGTSGSLDSLPDTSVNEIVSVVQGGTTYTVVSDYILNGDSVDWSPGGDEPTSGTSYDVTYRYLDAVAPDAVTDDTVTLSGGVTGGAVLLSYSWKLPRTDLLCLDRDGAPVYVRGISTTGTPRAPSQPASLLALAEIANDWRGTPTITNTEVRSIPFSEMWHYLGRLFDLIDLVALERLKSDIDTREPVAKKGVFVDPFEDETYRDAGEVQTAAVFDGQMQLAIEAEAVDIGPSAQTMLAYTEAVVLQQELFTSSMRINPYQNFDPLPGTLTLDPATDFWTISETETSTITKRVTSGSSTVTTTTTTETEALEYLREIDVDFTIEGFAAGENLDALTFDGLDVNPGGLTADGNGELSGTFTIPSGVLAGTKLVQATGEGGTVAEAEFQGQGTLEINTVVRTVVQRVDPLAQTFVLDESRQIVGVDLHCDSKGSDSNPVVVEIRSTDNGWPTSEILATTTVDMSLVNEGAWFSARFDNPVLLQSDITYCFVVKTNDADHALSTARIGDFDASAQRYVSAQAYSVGVLLSSSNADTWTTHQNEDLAFRIVAAEFTETAKTVTLGSFAVTDMSDIRIMAATLLPSSDTSIYFEVERADGSVTKLLSDQVWSLSEFANETITLRAVLSGTAKESPILYPNGLMIVGTIQTTGTYISRAFTMGSAIRMSTFLKTKLPSGSTLTVEVDAADDNWTTVAQHAAEVLDEGWMEREYRVDPYTATQGRLRLTLTGGPGSRPYLSDLRAVAI